MSKIAKLKGANKFKLKVLKIMFLKALTYINTHYLAHVVNKCYLKTYIRFNEFQYNI